MSFACLAYSVVNAGAATNADMTAATDPDYTVRNSHYIFTEQYKLVCDFIDGATVTRGRYQVPTWNAIGEATIYPPNNGAAVIPSNPQLLRYTPYNPPVPMNEEFQMQVTCTAAETDYGAIWIATPDWQRGGAIPGTQRILVRATASVAKTLNSWSGGGAITLSSNLRGGVYAVLGAQCFCANSLFFRLIFPRVKLYRGRKQRPGWVCQNAVADIPAIDPYLGMFEMGVWGYFHTFELPQIEVFGNVAGAATQELRMYCAFVGEDLSLLDQYVSTS